MCLCAFPIALQCSRPHYEKVQSRTVKHRKETVGVYDKEQGNLIRLHVCERKGFFNPNGVKECPVDLTLFARTRTQLEREQAIASAHGCPMDRTDGFQNT